MDVRLPRLAEGVESGTVVNILVAEGQEIKKDQPIMELETQKAVGSIPSPESGTVTKIHVKEGMEVSVGQLLISLATGAPEAVAPQPPPARALRAEPEEAPAEPPPAAAPQPDLGYQYESKSGFPPPAAPSVRKIARELGIDLTRVRGSQAGGRIVLEDLRAYVQELQRLAQQARTAAPVPEAPGRAVSAEIIDFSKWGPIRRERLSPLRRTVSQRMVQSWTTVPKINQFDDCDITGILALRKKHAAAYEKKGAHLTLTAFVLKVTAAALRKHPRANASLDETTGEIVFKDYCHIGIAVDTEAGLIVPTLRDADKKTLLELAIDLQVLTEKTRQRKVSIEDLQGGTFTISNQGSIGGSHFTPIIYTPQVAILGVGRGRAQPVAVGDKITVRTILPLCLAYDHRVLDGADAVRFLNDITSGLAAFPESDVQLNT